MSHIDEEVFVRHRSREIVHCVVLDIYISFFSI